MRAGDGFKADHHELLLGWPKRPRPAERTVNMTVNVRSLFLGMLVLAAAFCPIAQAQPVLLENDALRIEIETDSGCFAVAEKSTGQEWRPDPWKHAAGVLRARTPNGGRASWNLSKCRDIKVIRDAAQVVKIIFRSPVAQNGAALPDVAVTVQLQLDEKTPDLAIRVLDVQEAGGYTLTDLEFPARQFSLRSEVDRGMAVIPYHSGVVVPSYLFPMPSSQFGEWTDWHHQAEMIFEFRVYGHLLMPWYGIHSERSGVMTLLPDDGSVTVQYIQNYNDRARVLKQTGKESTYPNLLALSPVWKLQSRSSDTAVRYYFMPRANYVRMAKRYRAIVREKGIFVFVAGEIEEDTGCEQDGFNLQISTFGNGTVVAANLGLLDQTLPDGTTIPGRAFRIRHADCSVTEGRFQTALEIRRR